MLMAVRKLYEENAPSDEAVQMATLIAKASR